MRTRKVSNSKGNSGKGCERLRMGAILAWTLGLWACGSSSESPSQLEDVSSSSAGEGEAKGTSDGSPTTDPPSTAAGAQPKARPGDPLCAGVPNGGACGPRASCRDGVCIAMRCGDGRRAPHEQCDDGNLRSGDGCSMHCRAEYCGDGIRQAAREACDDGLFAPAGPCNERCILRASCGDGRLDPYEECDDGNVLAQDGCSPQCTRESSLPRCGNGRVDPGEQCDDGNLTGNDGCTAQCLREFCGDGILQSWEGCDDGNRNNDDGCTNQCWLPASQCGNARLDPGEECDDGNYFNEDDCPNDCLLARCGDGIWEGREGCDDGNLISNDGCSALCRPEFDCGNAQLERGEQCDDGNTNNLDDCPNDCQYPRCGDGVLEGRELCEPQLSGTLCSPECKWLPLCGDGVLTPPEQCDDGNLISDDGCSADCRNELCGNGIVDPGEACDDGNRLADDGCSECQHDWLNRSCSACMVKSCTRLDLSERCAKQDLDCWSVLDCYFESNCIDAEKRGALACFCGDGVETGPCADPSVDPSPSGACLEPIVKSVGTRLATEVVKRFNKQDFGAGRASASVTCMIRKCRELCLPERCDPSLTPSTCDDGLACTRSRCSEAGVCVHEPLAEGELCPAGRCSQGQCVQCLQASDCATAEVADRCHEAPRCEEQRCVQGAALVCEQDDNPCTQSSCDSEAGCQAQNLVDGTPCGEGRNCRAGRCEAVDEAKLKEVVVPVGLQGAESHDHGIFPGLPWFHDDYRLETTLVFNQMRINRVAFHCFDLSQVEGVIVGAQLRIVQPAQSYSSRDEQETVIYRSLEAKGPDLCNRLRPGGAKPDLWILIDREFSASGTDANTFGELTLDASINRAEGESETKISIVDLNPAAIASLNSYRGGSDAWPVGVYLVPNFRRGMDAVFFGSSVDAPNQLVLQVQEP